MSARALEFAIVLTIFVAGLSATAIAYVRRKRAVSGQGWEAVMKQLAAIDHAKVELIASDLLHSHEGDSNAEADCLLDPGQISQLIGGMEGLELLERNCDVLVALACVVQEQYPEALVIAEQLRLNAREIKWHIERLRGAATRGKLEAVFPEYAQRAVATYYVMTQTLLTFCEAVQLPQYAELRNAL